MFLAGALHHYIYMFLAEALHHYIYIYMFVSSWSPASLYIYIYVSSWSSASLYVCVCVRVCVCFQSNNEISTFYLIWALYLASKDTWDVFMEFNSGHNI